MTTNGRRVAADTRRIAADAGIEDRDQIRSIRALVRRNYERGLEEGRASERHENAHVNPRTMMLTTAAEILEKMSERAELIPNSERACYAYNEAAAILRDAAASGEGHLG